MTPEPMTQGVPKWFKAVNWSSIISCRFKVFKKEKASFC